MVYVIAKDGTPLMPTERHGKVKWLLRKKKAKVESACPFTIRLLYEPEKRHVQPVTLGVDAGSSNIGLSASTGKKELFSGKKMLRDDVPKNMKDRSQARQTRRSRLRHRKPRFDNRKRPDGWLTPTMETKLRSHVNVVNDICSILPVSRIIVETASFDIQKIKDEDIEGKRYQEGEQLGYANVKAYVKARDGFRCWACHGKDYLEVHHIIRRRDGGSDRPANLITLCGKCHTAHHSGKKPLDIPSLENRGFRAATEMSTMRWFLLDRLKVAHPDIPVEQSYGYITAWNRREHSIEKTHTNDAFCIAGNFKAERVDAVYDIMKVRCHNRQVMKQNIRKGGKLKRNQAPRMVRGIARYDVVRYEDGRTMIVTARKERGLYSLKPADGSATLTDVPRRKFTLLWHSNGEIVTRRPAFPRQNKPDGALPKMFMDRA